MTLTSLVLIASCLTASNGEVAACTCVPIPPLTSEEAVRQVGERSSVIFDGTVLSVVELSDSVSIRARRLPQWSTRLATIEVHQRWKGAAADTVVVEAIPQTTMCGFSFSVGARYLVFAQDSRYGLTTSKCSPTRLMDSTAAEVIRLLGRPEPRGESQSVSRDTSRPIFEVEMWPGEGIPVFEAVTDLLVLLERPHPSAAIAHELRVAPGQRVSFDSTRFQTIVPGRLRVLAPAELRGRVLGAIDRLTREDYYSNRLERTVVSVDTATQLEYLQYRAEGTCFVRLGGQVINGENCHTSPHPVFVLERDPLTRWWIRVAGPEGRVGWLLVTDRTARVVERRF